MNKILEVLGIKVILNYIKEDTTFNLMISFKTGSRHEKENERGLSHLLEHTMFTGTNTRDSYKITEELDFYGASYNAYTSKEETVYYFDALSSKQKEICDIMFDMVTDPIFPEEQISKEKEVIFEEIKMSLDNTRSVVFEMMNESMIEGNLKYNIIGTKDSVSSITRDMLLDYYKRRYTRDNLIISVSGNYDEKLLLEMIEKYFVRLNENKIDIKMTEDKLIYIDKKIEHNINQTNIYMMTKMENDSNDIKKNYIETILITILGDGFSSRLFQEIREKRALAYSVYTYTLDFLNLNLLGIYIGTSKNKYEEAIQVSKDTINELIDNGVTERELERVKNYILSTRATSKQNSKISSRNIRMYDRYSKIYSNLEIEEILRTITAEDINNSAREILKNFSVCVIGELDV